MITFYQNVFKGFFLRQNMDAEKPIEAKRTVTHKLRENPWILSTIVLGVFTVILFFGSFSGSMTGNVVKGEDVAARLLNFYSANGAQGLQLSSVEEVSGLYKINFLYQNTTVPIYVTRDGKYAGSLSLLPDENSSQTQDTQTPTEVPKSDKPTVELYVFTYCPYGLQMEKAILPAINLFKDKITFKIRQIGAMHGEHEKIEAERQLCIEKNYPTKFLQYVNDFALSTDIGNCNGNVTCVTPKLTALYTKLGIDGKKIDSCISSEGESLYNTEVQNSEQNGVSGSPTTIINGVTVQLSRNADAIKNAICDAFNTAPTECSQTLSSASPAAGFGGETSGSSSTASC